ncbi:MAG: bifunctional folylpolyglutamate synthase/dihydrofolate synthase [Actinobacteria bacterium]|nr:bifunctional folylpolyglutamate synthase/dihydrofolate synthase [Actinomycetota bacterium]
MGFKEAEAFLDALGVDAMKLMRPSTARIEAMVEALDHPERAVPAIHITGTNGKSSTARIATSLLTATGLKVGTYTSPHLESVRERIALDGESVGEEDFGEVFDHLHKYLEFVQDDLGQQLTYFEVLTAMFYLWAADNVDAMVVEVGLGGRWDATNVIDAPVSVITNISLDHTSLMGSSREGIALEKAGIISANGVVVTAERTLDAFGVIAGEANARGATVSAIDRDFSATDNRVALGGRYLSVETSGTSYRGMFLPLHGSHQGVNAATAVDAVAHFLGARPLSDEVVRDGLAAVRAPGRIEVVRPPEAAAPVVLDVAHNPDGMSALISSLVEAFAFDHVRFVVGILADKDYRGMLSELARIPCSLTVTRPANVRSIPVTELAAAAGELGLEFAVVEDVAGAVDSVVSAVAASELVCVTGSHYVVGEARAHLGST